MLGRAVVLLLALAACRDNKPAPATNSATPSATASAKRPPTTSAPIAVSNLNGDIDVRMKKENRTPEETEGLAELLLTRSQFLGKVADLDQADALAVPGTMARIHVDSALHKFDDALRGLDAATGVAPDRIKRARAAILLARGDYDATYALMAKDAESRDPQRLTFMAVLAAKMQKPDESVALFDRARANIRDVSPFPLAWIDFQRGTLDELAGDDAKAKTWFGEAVDVLSVYAHAEVHLAPTQPPADAITKLELIRKMSDDPEIPAALAAAHQRAGHADDAAKLLAEAKTGYEALVAKHPEAFADHAARFWLAAGGDATKALDLARLNKNNRSTEDALDLWMAAAAGAQKPDEVCQAANALLHLKYLSPRTKTVATAAKCD